MLALGFAAGAASAARAEGMSAASASGDITRSCKLVSGFCLLPHPEKVATGGEDACFIGSDGLSVGVADGVGGWADVGVDAGAYARLLMSRCKQFAEELSIATAEAAAKPASSTDVASGEKEVNPGKAPELDLLRVLVRAHAATSVPGSSTACLVVLRGTVLYAANLGDSGFLLLRSGRIVYASPKMQHAFNFPFQLGSHQSDPPGKAMLFKVPAQVGDVILLATDGVFDNLFQEEIARVVSGELGRGGTPTSAAEQCAKLAHLRGADSRTMSPFAQEARTAGLLHRGGKLDDVCVVVGIITAQKEPQL